MPKRTIATLLAIAGLAGAAHAASPAAATEEIVRAVSPETDFEVFGYLEEIDVHYAMTCEGGSFDEMLLVRETQGEPLTWTGTVYCARGVSLRDIDQNGTPEILFFRRGGGTGYFGVQEIYFSWPEGDPAPTEGVSFAAMSHSEWMAWIDEENNVFVSSDNVAELPEGAVCDDIHTCPIVKDGLFCVEGCNSAPRRALLELPGWPAFVQMMYDRHGLRLANPDVPPEFSEIELAPLPEGGSAPEISEERRAEFEDFLGNL